MKYPTNTLFLSFCILISTVASAGAVSLSGTFEQFFHEFNGVIDPFEISLDGGETFLNTGNVTYRLNPDKNPSRQKSI